MHTLRLSVVLPDENHPEMEVRVSADELPCDVLVSVVAACPAADLSASRVPPQGGAANDTAPGADDDYVLGGYAGI